MMLVSDLDRSMEFYTKLLGMDVQRIVRIRTKGSASATLGTAPRMNIRGWN